MNWISVTSSNLSAVAYDDQDNSLYIEFKQSGIYKYPNIDKSLYLNLLNAPSKGSFHAVNIKHLPFVKLS